MDKKTFALLLLEKIREVKRFVDEIPYETRNKMTSAELIRFYETQTSIENAEDSATSLDKKIRGNEGRRS
jgi:hypothetical protein